MLSIVLLYLHKKCSCSASSLTAQALFYRYHSSFFVVPLFRDEKGERTTFHLLSLFVRSFPYLLTSAAGKGRMPLVKDRFQKSEAQFM